ncbi:MAG: Fe(2+) transporter FeoB [Verrucomicrobiae bacterium]|nr:Fe(2+) transporter FeoB [Verrucomicrobiae bacterium]
MSASCCPPATSTARGIRTIALAGNPNSGKTTLFNALTGMRAQTANYPGTTVERRVGRFEDSEIIDLPGLYDLEALSEEERIAARVITAKPDAVIIVADALNLSRSLFLTSQILEHGVPVVMALNMMDLAEEAGLKIDAGKLAQELGCPVIPIVARSGRGLDDLRAAIRRPAVATPATTCGACNDCRFKTRYAWTDAIAGRVMHHQSVTTHKLTERLDHVLTHPVIGVMAFVAVMLGVFFLIFQMATIPMDLIDGLFSQAGAWVAQHLPANDLRELLVQGVIGGVGGMLVFLPQICILFFCLALLEDTGYLARAAFVMDRLMRHVGLPGNSFVPLLSAHACAIPAIMATRVIEDKRDRLMTIMVLPLISCSARIPVYSMLAALLFADSAWKAAVVFTGAYLLGVLAALVVSFALKRTILRGESRPLVLELPSYKLPSLRTAVLMTMDRAWVFIKNAGTVILAISIILWALATYPKSEPPREAVALQEQAAKLTGAEAQELQKQADRLIGRSALENSVAGRVGRWIEPVLQPLGFDWQIGIGIISSFAAREVVVSTLAVVYGVGEDVAEENPDSLYDSLRKAERTDGTKVFTTATCVSLLVFYVLAMQCLATQAVTRRETNSWKWPVFQLLYMTVLAYGAALVTFQVLRAFGVT